MSQAIGSPTCRNAVARQDYRFWDKWTGYQGLASHGGTIGLMLALWIYSRRVKLKFLTVLDNIAIATPLAGCFIRLGNLMNGEIVGTVTHVPWASFFRTKICNPAIRHNSTKPSPIF